MPLRFFLRLGLNEVEKQGFGREISRRRCTAKIGWLPSPNTPRSPILAERTAKPSACRLFQEPDREIDIESDKTLALSAT